MVFKMANYLQLSELIYKLNKVKVYIFNGKFRCKYFEYMFKSVRKRKYNILKRSWHVVCIPLKKKCQNIATMRKIYMYCEEWAFWINCSFVNAFFLKNQLKMHFMVKHTTFFVKILDHVAKSPTATWN